jgi:YVTN family beta-propeller protein
METFNICVAGAGSNDVSVIDGSVNTVIGTIAVGQSPIALAYDSSNGDVYISVNIPRTIAVIDTMTNATFGAISVIEGSTNKMVGSTMVGFPIDILYDSSNRDLYLKDILQNSVVVPLLRMLEVVCLPQKYRRPYAD